MIRDENLASFLISMAEELQSSVRPELKTDHARKVVDSFGLMLGRMIAEAGGAQETATESLPQWHALEKRFAALGYGGTTEAAGNAKPLGKLESAMSGLQGSLEADASFDRLVEELQSGAPATRAVFEDSALEINRMLQAIEDSFYRTQGRKGAASVGDNLDALSDALAIYLRERFPELPEDPIVDLAVASGGQIKRTALITLRDNSALPTRIVLRQDMPMNFTGTVVTDEFETLKRVHALGLPVPEPILVEPDAERLGGCFMLMTEVADAKPAGTYFAEERKHLGTEMGPGFGHEMAGLLARLHSGTQEHDPEAGRRAEEDRQRAVEEVWRKWQAQTKPSFTLPMAMGFAWLKAHSLGPDRPRCLLHGDVGAHNAMTRDGKLAAMLDWELASMGDPADDLAQARMLLLPDTMPWDAFKVAYIEQGGIAEAVDNAAVSWYAIWTFLRHGSMNADLWRYFVNGQRDDAAAAGVASHFVDRLSLYAARALANAVEDSRR